MKYRYQGIQHTLFLFTLISLSACNIVSEETTTELMTDQDPDGSHIKGLLINMLHRFWPALLEHDGFLYEFVTPLVKVT